MTSLIISLLHQPTTGFFSSPMKAVSTEPKFMNYLMPDVMSRGSHVANLLAFKPTERIAQVISLRDYSSLPYLVIATRSGMVKKSPLLEYDSNRSGGLIAISLKDGDEVVSAATITNEDQLLLISEQGMSLRFEGNDESLRLYGPINEWCYRHEIPWHRPTSHNGGNQS